MQTLKGMTQGIMLQPTTQGSSLPGIRTHTLAASPHTHKAMYHITFIQQEVLQSYRYTGGNIICYAHIHPKSIHIRTHDKPTNPLRTQTYVHTHSQQAVGVCGLSCIKQHTLKVVAIKSSGYKRNSTYIYIYIGI